MEFIAVGLSYITCLNTSLKFFFSGCSIARISHTHTHILVVGGGECASFLGEGSRVLKTCLMLDSLGSGNPG